MRGHVVTMPGPGIGGTPPMPPGYQPPTLPGVAAGSVNIFRGRLVLVFGPSGAVTGIFVYQAGTTPGAGNPPIFWATSGTADPFGNSLPSIVGVASPGKFQAGNTLIEPAGIFQYGGTPALGNLVVAVAPVAGTDDFGNPFTAGVLVNQGQLILANSLTPAASAIGPVVFGQANGHLQVVDSTDGQLYDTQHRDLNLTSNTLVNSTSALNIPELGLATVGPGKYKVEGTLIGTVGGTATTPRWRLSGPATSACLITYQHTYESATGESMFAGNVTSLGVFSSSAISAFPATAVFHARFRGVMTFTAAGALTTQVAVSVAGQSFTLAINSFLTVTPV